MDVIGEGFDAALRIATLPDSSLMARRLCGMPNHLVAAPAYLKAHGRPKPSAALAEHACLGYAYQLTPDTWHFRTRTAKRATVHPARAACASTMAKR